MTQAKRQAILAGVMLVMLMISALWSLGWMLGQRSRAQRAAGDLASCRQLADRMAGLRSGPVVASAKDMGVRELGRRIDTASKRANLGASALRGVDPRSPRPVDDTPYLRKLTTMDLESVTLSQLASFLYHLTGEPGLVVRDLDLRTPRPGDHGKRWNATATLSYLIYSPQRAKESNR